MAKQHDLLYVTEKRVQTPAEMAETKRLVEADPERFVKWANRKSAQTGTAWKRKLPDGEFTLAR